MRIEVMDVGSCPYSTFSIIAIMVNPATSCKIGFVKKSAVSTDWFGHPGMERYYLDRGIGAEIKTGDMRLEVGSTSLLKLVVWRNTIKKIHLSKGST